LERLTTILLALATTAVAPAQLRITEVLADPIGPNQGTQIVEVTNDLNIPVALSGWHASGGGVSLPLPAVTVRAYQILRIHVGQGGLSSPADLFLPTMPELPPSGTFTLHRGADPNDPALVVDFVAWAGGQQGISAAVAANQWPSTLVSVPLPATEGATIAHLGAAAFDTPDEPSAWYQDSTPTVGLENDAGSIFNLLMGCPGADPAPWIGLARPESRPWIGERFELDIFNLPPTVRSVGLLLGLQRTPPLPLDPIGLTGCGLLISQEFGVQVGTLGGQGLWVTRIPPVHGLVGARFFLQAFAPYPGAPNPAQALMSNAIVCTIGSR
jgi:hypothetical protein